MSGSVLWDVDTQVDFMLPLGKLYVPDAEQTVCVGICEHVEALLEEQELAPTQPSLRHLGQRQRHGVELLRLDNLLGTARAA